MEAETDTPQKPAPKQENLFYNLAFNLVIPILLLNKGTEWLGIGPDLNLMVALAFPIGYGIYDGITRRKVNFLSILGFVSVLIKGGIGVLELPKEWVAINEAALPLVIGIAILVTAYTKRPLIKALLYSDQVFDVERIEKRLEERQTRPRFERLLRVCTYWFAASLLVSAVLNYIMAQIFIKTDPAIDKVQFNKELGAMQGWSYLFIMLPTMIFTCYALWLLVKGIRELTGLSFEEALRQKEESKGAAR